MAFAGSIRSWGMKEGTGHRLLASMIRSSIGSRYVCSVAPAKVTRMPRGYWDVQENRTSFHNRLVAEYGIEKPEDWKRVTTAGVRSLGGRTLLRRYGDSVFEMLKDLSPEDATSEDACRARKPRGYWQERSNRRKLLEHVAEVHGVKQPSDWAKVTSDDVLALGGSSLLKMYKSLVHALKDAFPEQEFDASVCRAAVPRDHWSDRGARKAFVERLAKLYDVQEAGDWQRVGVRDVRECGGDGLLRLYPSLHEMLRDLAPGYSDISVEEGRKKLPRNFWAASDNVRAFLDRVGQQLGVSEADDWYRVSYDQLRDVGAGGLLRKMRFIDALTLAYPDVKWDTDKVTNKSKKAGQRHLRMSVQELMPGVELLEDYKHPDLPNVRGSGKLELDLYLPEHQVGIEFHGIHHYEEVPHFGSLEMYQRRDRAKAELCEAAGIRLVVIPHWWDQQLPSLAATLHTQCPSLLPAASRPDSVI